MRRLGAVLLVGVVLGPGCMKKEGPVNMTDEAIDPATRRTVSIYEAVIRRLVTTEDSTFGADPRFPVIYVVHRPKQDAANPNSPGGEPPFSDEVKRGMLVALSDLPVEFVSDQDDVVIEEGGGVQREGVVVTVGPIPEGDRIEVEASLYAGPLAATWLTYVVRRLSQGWQVTGTTGPVAIS
jgi:hypothetical protein